MSDDYKIVWSDKDGDLRKKNQDSEVRDVDESKLLLEVRRLTSGKGRTIIEVSALPNHKKWCQKLAKELKKKLAVGGAYKQAKIEIHGEKLSQLTEFLDSKNISWKKI